MIGFIALLSVSFSHKYVKGDKLWPQTEFLH